MTTKLIINEIGHAKDSRIATEQEIRNSCNNGPDWLYEEHGIIEESGLDDNPDTLYCLFEGSYFQGIFNMAGLKDCFTEFVNPAFNPVYKFDHWVCTLVKGGTNEHTK